MQTAVTMSDPAPDWTAGSATAIDSAYLARVTFGNRGLEREVLQLFDRQAGVLIARMRASEPGAIGALVHTLKGSALNIGAHRVAKACVAVEADPSAIDQLAEAVDEARARIGEMLWLGD